MTLEDLLDELRNNILRDIAAPYLWTDGTLVRYIDDAQRRFARRTLCIRDATTLDVTQVTLETAVENYTLHPSVLAVISARYDTDTTDLARVGHSQVSGAIAPDTLWFDINTITGFPPGRPRAVLTDEQIDTDAPGKAAISLRVYPAPTLVENGKIIYLRVARLPMAAFSENNLSAVCEIPEDYQLDLLEWAAYRARRTYDADAGDSVKADSHRARFEEAVKEAQTEMKRKLFAPLKWGFGRNGFTHTR